MKTHNGPTRRFQSHRCGSDGYMLGHFTFTNVRPTDQEDGFTTTTDRCLPVIATSRYSYFPLQLLFMTASYIRKGVTWRSSVKKKRSLTLLCGLAGTEVESMLTFESKSGAAIIVWFCSSSKSNFFFLGLPGPLPVFYNRRYI